jgi:hypothetical protein
MRGEMILLIVLIFILLVVILSLPKSTTTNTSPIQITGSNVGKLSNVSQALNASKAASLPEARYDEQGAISFTDTFTSLAYNVTAIAQSDQNGYGPAYLVQGLTPNGFWYQVGLAYNWTYPNNRTGYNPGFQFIYEVFAPNGSTVSGLLINNKANYGSIAKQFAGQIHSGDKVLLNLYFLTNGTVRFYVKDWNTGASQVAYFSSEGATQFNGTGGTDGNGFFTGIMTEWYHESPNYTAQYNITYQPYGHEQTSGRLLIDQKYNETITYSKSSTIIPYYGSGVISSHNITVTYDNGTFVTKS